MSMERFTPVQMKVMGFVVISYDNAIGRGFHPSKDGDPIWLNSKHPSFWSQGVPFCETFFEHVFQYGAGKGQEAKMREIREALGL